MAPQTRADDLRGALSQPLSSAPGSPGGSSGLLPPIPIARRASSLRASFDSAARQTAFFTHSPFDSGMAADDEAAGAALLSPMASTAAEPACKADGSVPTWADAAAEARRLMSLAVPLMLQSLSSMLLTLVSTMFVGRLNDPVALSGVVLASSVYNVSGISMVIGLSSALDTLCGQAYGAKAYRMLGVYLQRARLICWALCLPVAALWLNARSVLLAIGQEPEIVDVASRYLLILTPSLFIAVLQDTARRYLLAQRVVAPGMAASIVTTCLSPLYNYYFIHALGLRTDGAALAVLACVATNATLLNGYVALRDTVLRRGRPDATWGGCSPSAALAGWGQYLHLGIPAAAMICLEWWVWELMIVAAGWLPNADVAVGVMGLLMSINSIFYMVPSSLGSATSTRVANSLGAGNPAAAALVFRVALCLGMALAAAGAGAIYLCRAPLVGLFTTQPDAVALALAVMPVMALSLLGDSAVAVLGCVLRAAGRQLMGAALNAAGYWCVGLPLAMFLGFKAGYATLGFWAGLATASALQGAIFATVIFNFDWQREVVRAAEMLRANRERSALPPEAFGGVAAGAEGAAAGCAAGIAAADEEQGGGAGGGGSLTQPLLAPGAADGQQGR